MSNEKFFFFKNSFSGLGINPKIVNEKLIVLEAPNYGFAFDVFDNEKYIEVFFVFRRNAVNRDFIYSKYKDFEDVKKYKTSLKIFDRRCTLFEISEFLKKEYLELVNLFYQSSNKGKIYYVDSAGDLNKSQPIKAWFSDAVLNFGDFLTPWLIGGVTGRPVVNTRWFPKSEGAILGVGSILGYVSEGHRKIKVWGSGLIDGENLNHVAAKLKSSDLSHVYACRGKVTLDFFEKNGFSCDKVLGDPGLIVNDIYSSSIKSKYKYCIVPHYVHYELFKDVEIQDCVVIDVRESLTSVIGKIASSENVISSSLHGLIIAQSFGIPWRHMHVKGARKLIGDKYKFIDFYSIFNGEFQSSEISSDEINALNIMKIFNLSRTHFYNSSYSKQALFDSLHAAIGTD